LMLPGVAFMMVQAVSAAVVFMGEGHRDALILGTFNLGFCIVIAASLSAAFGSPGAALSLSLAEVVSFASFAWLIRHRHRPRSSPSGRAARRKPARL
jgi:peptidoglycan biosynthesis protein MviN/MurJ (putative lipid II flippase)